MHIFGVLSHSLSSNEDFGYDSGLYMAIFGDYEAGRPVAKWANKLTYCMKVMAFFTYCSTAPHDDALLRQGL